MNKGSNQIEQSVQIPPAQISADLCIPSNAKGLVLFAHGSGSSRLSPRNRFVAGIFHQTGFATLLLDLLTPDEEETDLRTRRLRFDINLLAKRLIAATMWSQGDSATAKLPLAYFGASTGAAAALVAASQLSHEIRAVVSRGGRPDLAGAALRTVTAPTLLIVGGNDASVIGLNKTALAEIQCEKKLAIVPGASHLFEEPGTLDQVARLAREWFGIYFATPV